MAQEPIIYKITVKPATRQTADIGIWRRALIAADKGKKAKLYDLYEDLLIDGVLSDAVDKRIEAITNAELAFQSNGESIEEMEDLIDTPKFEELLKEIMLAKFWGVTVLEFDFADGFNFTSLPRKHIRADLKEILIQEHDDRGIPYGDDPFVIQIGGTGHGLFLKTAPFAIYKRGGFGDWAQWIELFGMPQRIGKYSTHDPEGRRLLEEAFEQAGSAPSMVVPKETEVVVTNQGNGSNGTSYDQFRKACNEEILVAILGQTMTTLDGSSRSQSEVHKEVEEGKNKADRRFVQRVLNNQILPLLRDRGFPVKNGAFYFPEAGETLTTQQRLDKDMKLADIIDISAEYFYETYDIPKPDKGAALAKKSTAPTIEDIKNFDFPQIPEDAAQGRPWYKRLVDFFG